MYNFDLCYIYSDVKSVTIVGYGTKCFTSVSSVVVIYNQVLVLNEAEQLYLRLFYDEFKLITIVRSDTVEEVAGEFVEISNKIY